MRSVDPSLFDDLQWRGLVAVSTDVDALRDALTAGPVTFYCGFDPTAPSLHIGHLVQLLTMRRMQDAGHFPLALVGGATGLIGDPKPTAERILHDKETVANWVQRVRGQVERYLSFEGDNKAVVVNNLDWTAAMPAIDFLRDIGKHFRVNKMIAKEAVTARLNSDTGISYTEFSYQILQALDFLELFRRHGCALQTGGSDQWGNLTAGLDLIGRAEGASVHAFATPLLTKADGSKFGKTESGTVWLDPAMTSPYAFYQFWINAEDSQVGSYLRVFTNRSKDEIEALEKAAADRPAAREAQRALAADVTALVHGAQESDAVVAASVALFGGGSLRDLEEKTLAAAIAELPTLQVHAVNDGRLPAVVDLLAETGLCSSRSAARRTVAEGGAYLNNERITDDAAVPDVDALLHRRWLLLRRGKRNLAAVEVRLG